MIKIAYAGQLNSFTRLRALLVLLDGGKTMTASSNHAYTGQLNSFTHLRVLLVLLDRGILGPVN
jgi:hypothetical protein